MHSCRRYLLTKELNRRSQLLVAATNFEKEQRLVLFKQVGRLVSGPVEKFLLAKRNQDERDLQLVHQKKLQALGLSINKDSLQVVRSFSNRVLSVFETEQLSKGLDSCFFPTKLHLNNIRAEFQRVYSELKRFFVARDLLVLKQKLMSLYGRYVSTFFHERKRHTCAMSENESSALHALCKDSNMIISKPDKGNGVWF